MGIVRKRKTWTTIRKTNSPTQTRTLSGQVQAKANLLNHLHLTDMPQVSPLWTNNQVRGHFSQMTTLTSCKSPKCSKNWCRIRKINMNRKLKMRKTTCKIQIRWQAGPRREEFQNKRMSKGSSSNRQQRTTRVGSSSWGSSMEVIRPNNKTITTPVGCKRLCQSKTLWKIQFNQPSTRVPNRILQAEIINVHPPTQVLYTRTGTHWLVRLQHKANIKWIGNDPQVVWTQDPLVVTKVVLSQVDWCLVQHPAI